MSRKGKSILVSVVIPTYNSALWIADALNSVVNQVFKGNIEILVVDDGSEDNIQQVVEPYVKNYDIKFFKINHKGAAAARNYGLQKSKGKYVAFLDSDDYWVPYKLKLQIEKLDKNKNVKLVLSDSFFVDVDKKFIKIHRNFIPKEKNTLLKNFFLCGVTKLTPTILVDKEIALEMGGFNEDMLQREDHFFLMKIIDKYEFSYIHSPLAYVRLRGGSTSDSSKFVDLILQKQLPFIFCCVNRWPFLKKYQKNLIASLFYKMAMKSRNISARQSLLYLFKGARCSIFQLDFLFTLKKLILNDLRTY